MFAPAVEKFGKNTIICGMSQYNYRIFNKSGDSIRSEDIKYF